MRLDISDLQVFVNVVEGGSISQGAVRSHLAVASASARIKDMELALGCPLLTRERFGVKPTETGRALLHHAYPLLRASQQMQAEVASYGRRQVGYVKLFSNSIGLVEYLPGPLCAFLDAHPEVNVRVEELLSSEIVDGIEEGSADIGLIGTPVDTRGLVVLPLRRERLAVIVRKGGGLFAGARSLRVAQLLEHDIVGLGRQTGLQMMLEDYARGVGKPLRQRVQLRNFDATCSVVSGSSLVGIVPESSARRWQAAHGTLRIIRIGDPWARLDLSLCVKSLDGLSVHSRRLVDALRAAAPPA